MTLSTHLTFRGDCDAAFRFYAEALGGAIGPMLSYGATPAGAGVSADFRDKIVHGTITIAGMQVNGADVRPEDYKKPQGFFLLLSARDVPEAARVFARLADGGEVLMALDKTFWSPAFGVVVDRFGVPWEVSCEQA